LHAAIWLNELLARKSTGSPDQERPMPSPALATIVVFVMNADDGCP
jgi:hypothetical protein